MLDDDKQPSTYYHTILARAQAINPALVIDDTLFRSLLLVWVAKQEHLIVRTAEEDIPKILKHVVHIVYTLFNVSVVKLRLHKSEKLLAEDFLRLMFLENGPEHTSRTFPHKTVRNMAVDDIDNPPCTSRSNVFQRLSDCNSKIPERQTMMRLLTDPTPYRTCDGETEEPTTRTSALPQVLVISGMEHTSEAVQRALWMTLARRRISCRRKNDEGDACSGLEIAIPEDFFVVLVCQTGDGKERPPLYNALLDRFALSVEVYPPDRHEFDTLSSQSPSEDRNISQSVLSSSELADLRQVASRQHTHLDGKLDLYLSDLFTATRHHAHLDGTLLSMRCRVVTYELLRTWRVLFGPAPQKVGKTIQTLSVNDDDVRKVFVRAVYHRLRVLDGPKHELLASFSFRAMDFLRKDVEWEVGRRTVKEILKEILETV